MRQYAEIGENCITRPSMIITPHRLLLGYKIKGGEMGGECGTNRVGKRLLSRYRFRKGNTI
jgi:hypothetical protein